MDARILTSDTATHSLSTHKERTVSMNARMQTPQTQKLTACQHTRNEMAMRMDARTPT